MSASLVSIWFWLAKLGLARPSAVEWTLLILLGASGLALPAFRENYFKIWVLGSTTLVASRFPERFRCSCRGHLCLRLGFCAPLCCSMPECAT